MTERTKKDPGERLGARAGGRAQLKCSERLHFIASRFSSSLFLAADCLIFLGGVLAGVALAIGVSA